MLPKNKILSWIFYSAVIALLVCFALQKVHDPDVWLHLGLGKYIVEHRALPAGDIFTFTSYGQPYEYLEWLFQASSYLLYKYAGYDGLMVFKLALWLLTLGLLWLWLRSEGIDSRWAALFSLLPAFWLARRWRERPEVLGYFFLVFYLWAVSRYRTQKSYYYLCILPLLQILWINFHPSGLLGIVILLMVLIGESLDYLWDKNKGDLKVIKALALIIPILMAVSLINPYGYQSLVFPVLYSSEMASKEVIIEWKPIWNFPLIHKVYLAFLIPAVLSFLPRLRRARQNLKLVDLMLFVAGGALPYISARYTTVFAVIALPVAIKNFYWLLTPRPEKAGKQKKKKAEAEQPVIPRARWALPVAALILALAVFWYHQFGGLWGWGLSRYAVPGPALAFLQQNKIPGPLFNQYEWGGYITLKAYPDYLPYIDSRGYHLEVVKEYVNIRGVQTGWEKLLEQRGINIMMLKSLNPADGSLEPLILELLKSPDWLLIWSEEAALIFLRNSEKNLLWAQKFTLPKAGIFGEMIVEGKHLIDNKVTGKTYYSMAWAYMNLGKPQAAKGALEEHLKINPQDQKVRKYLEDLTRQGY